MDMLLPLCHLSHKHKEVNLTFTDFISVTFLQRGILMAVNQ